MLDYLPIISAVGLFIVVLYAVVTMRKYKNRVANLEYNVNMLKNDLERVLPLE